MTPEELQAQAVREALKPLQDEIATLNALLLLLVELLQKRSTQD